MRVFICFLLFFIFGTNSLSDFIDPTVLYQSTSIIEDIELSVNQEKVYIIARTIPENDEIIVLVSEESGYSWKAPLILSNATDERQKDNLLLINYDNSTLFVYYLIHTDELFIGGNLYNPITDVWISLPERSLNSIVNTADYSSVILRGTEDMISLIWYNQKQISIASSVDHGNNWVTSTLLKYSTTYDWIFSSAVSFGSGVYILTAVGTQPTYPDSCHSIPTSLIVFRTEDYGKTWVPLTIANYATFPCCGDTRDISPVLTSDTDNDLDLLFFGNNTDASCAILFISSNDSGRTWTQPVSLSSKAPQNFIDPALATYSSEEVQLYWINNGGSLWRRFSTDGGATWTLSEAITQPVISDDIQLSYSHLDLLVDDFNLVHLVFSISTQTNTSSSGTIYYVQQSSLKHWYLKPLGLGLWITIVIVTILIVSGWFILAKWKQAPEFDTY